MTEHPKPMVLQPWFFVLACIAGWSSEQNRLAIEYLKAENAVLREKLGTKRILLNDDQRRRVASVGKLLGRTGLRELGSLFTPDTILAWHRKLIAEKYTSKPNGAGRPPLGAEVIALVVKMATENRSWGCDRIAGELKKLGHNLSDTSVENILKHNGIQPAPIRNEGGGSWAEFLKAHWECLAATDFTTVEVWTSKGLKTFYLLFIIELKSRKVQYLGSTENPNDQWMLDTVDRATCDGGILAAETTPRILIMDHDTKFTKVFKTKLEAHGIQPKLTAARISLSPAKMPHNSVPQPLPPLRFRVLAVTQNAKSPRRPVV